MSPRSQAGIGGPGSAHGRKAAQVLRECRRSGVAVGWALLEALQGDCLDVARQRGLEAARGDGGLLPDLPERLGDRRRAERRATREEGVEDRPQGVDVDRRPGPLRVAAGLLRGHVTGGPEDQVRPGDPAVCVEHLGQAEVGDLGPAVVGQQDVRGLEVAVDDAQAVRVVDRPGQGLHQLGRLAGRQRGAVATIVETAAVDVLELQVGPAVVIAQVVDLDDRRVFQARDGLGLGQKAGRGLGPGVGAGQDHLQAQIRFRLTWPAL